MKVAVFGAAGRTGHRVVTQALAAGHQVRGLVRRAEQVEALNLLGAEALVGDLLGEWEGVLEGVDAAVWAAGGHLDPAQYAQIDRDALIRVADVLAQRGPRRLIVVSSMGMNRLHQMPPFMIAALEAKLASDTHVQRGPLDWTIVRPGGLSDEAGTGRVQVAPQLPRGRISREDVAGVVVACLETPRTVHQTFDLLVGQQPIAEALAEL
ncbi:SDR family oxidoreductase [Deinococcus sp.]|uniref:SDR family oxidoreductase n=1 Tax=Deinococcus sp. TaxID=47478 RepID=UPI0025C04D8A|nr:SDR family oxidoreductase [Deinococcus sp.]